MQKKLRSRFSQNSVERWHMGHERNRWILVVIQIHYFSVRVRVTVSRGTTILCRGEVTQCLIVDHKFCDISGLG